MKTIGFKLAVAVATVALAISVQATQITGGLSLAGGYTVDTGNLNTANAFTSFSNVQITGVSGSYAGAGLPIGVANSVTMTPFTFSPFGPVVPLWQVAGGGGTNAAFNLMALTGVFKNVPNSLTLTGTGMLTLTGFEATFGTWIFTANQDEQAGTFSFSSSNAARAPDGGTTALLLGSAMAALALVRRKLG
jgi:hypothetical protein